MPRFLSPLAAGFLGVVLVGCGPVSSVTIGRNGPSSVHEHRGGPPPHAPAHGHRRKHRGPGDVELVFDSELGVYAVVDLPGHYFWEGSYLRIDGGRWFAATRLDGRWTARADHRLPPGLRKHAKHRKPSKGRGPKHRPAKPRW